LSKTLNDVFDPTFCVYRVPVYFQILICTLLHTDHIIVTDSNKCC